VEEAKEEAERLLRSNQLIFSLNETKHLFMQGVSAFLMFHVYLIGWHKMKVFRYSQV